MPDAYSYGTAQHDAPRPAPRKPLRFLAPLLLLVAIVYLLLFSPWAPFADLGARMRYAVTDATESLIEGDATGTPDEVLQRWEREFGGGEEPFDTAGPTATMLFRNNLRGLRNAVRRDEREKIKAWRTGIEKNFRTARAWREKNAPSPGD